MVTRRLSFALRLSDGCLNRALLSSEAGIYIDGIPYHHEYKRNGFFVVMDVPEGVHQVAVKSFKFQTETMEVNVDYSPEVSAQQRVYYLMLNPSAKHPEASRMPMVKGSVPGAEYIYILRERGEMKVAEDAAQAGNTQLRLFCGGATPQLPSVFRINDKKSANSEFVTLTGFNDNSYQLSAPLKYDHPRSSSVVPLIRVRCDPEGGFFFVIPGDFRPEKDSGVIALTLVSDSGGAVKKAQVEAAAAGVTELGTVTMKKEG
ncbi:MAG: hypothetical protein ACI4WS_13490 [Oscillospiraceae bacterium]